MSKKTGSRPRGIARNAISNWVAFLYVAGISFFLSPYIVKNLGATAYGVWSLLVALVGYLGLLDFGVRGAVTRFIAAHHAVGDTRASSSIASAAMVLFGGLGLAAIVLASVMAYLSPHFFNIPPALATDARVVLTVGGLTVAATLIGAVYGGIVTGLERFDISSGVEIFVTTLRTAAVVFVLWNGEGLVALAWVHFAGSVLYGIIAWRSARHVYPELRFDFRVPLKPHIKTILSFSAFLSAIHVLGVIIYYTDALVIAVVLPISAVAVFAIAGNLADYASKVSGALSKMMTPRVSALTSSGAKNVSDEVLGTARVATLAAAPIAATFFFRGESFIGIWMGPEFGGPSGAVLEVLAFIVLFGGARAVAGASIIGANQHRRLVPALAAEAVANLALSIVFAHLVGVVGVALGSLIPSLIIGILYFPYCLWKSVGVQPRQFYLRAWALPMLACIPFMAATFAIERFYPAHSLLMFFAQVLVTLPLVPAVALFVCATPAERAYVSRKIGAYFGGGAAAPPASTRQLLESGARVRVTPMLALRILVAERREVLRGVLSVIAGWAAYVLPLRALWWFSKLLAMPFALSQGESRRVWRDLRAAFGLTRMAAFHLAVRTHALRFYEFGFTQKVLLGRVDPFGFPVQIEAGEAARRIIDSSGSFVLATAHFVRGYAAGAVIAPKVFERPVHVVAARLPDSPLTPHLWRIKLQLNQTVRAARSVRREGLEFVHTGGAFNDLVDKLRTGRIMANLNVDAHWPKGRASSFSRPFGGFSNHTFSTGAAKLARLADVPIMLALPVFDAAPGVVRMRVLGPFVSGAADPEQRDREVTGQMLDAIEREVGRRPAEYALEIGCERYWHAGTESWSTVPDTVENIAAQHSPVENR